MSKLFIYCIVYSRSDSVVTINFSTQFGAATICMRVVACSVPACVDAATIYSEIPALMRKKTISINIDVCSAHR